MHEYKGQHLTVRWDTMKCVHSGVCVRRLPGVFDVKKKPWVMPDAAETKAVQDTIARCPSGALTWEAPPSA